MERYNEYKDSGVQWLGEIPSHWECEKAKRHFLSRKQIVGRNSSQYERLALTLKGVIKRFEGDGVGLNPEKLDTWHLDVIKTDKGYEMIVVAYDKWKNHNKMDLYYTISNDEVNFKDAIKILEPERGTLNWDNSGIYRSSIIYLNDTYYLYYGAVGVTAERGIGLAYGKDITNLVRDKTNYKDPKKVKRLIKKLER